MQYYLTFKIITYMIHVIVKKSRCKQHDIVRSKWKTPILKLRLVNNESVQANISGILQQAKNKNKIGLKSVDNHSPSLYCFICLQGLYAVFRKPATEQESICPGGQNIPEQSVQGHMEQFINTCCFHLWSTMQ